MEHTITQEPAQASHAMAGKLAALSWGVFFLWLGVALLLKIDYGITLAGVGLITLGTQAARRYFHLNVEGFWVVVGLLFLVGGLWELSSIALPLVPLLLILAGLALLFSLTRKKYLL